MKLLMKNGPVITVFVKNNCGVKTFAQNGPVMNEFVNNKVTSTAGFTYRSIISGPFSQEASFQLFPSKNQ